MNLIVACDQEWQIGRAGELLFRISDDLKRFKALTTGHPVILGRKTLMTFPGGKPLPNRANVILSRNPDYTCPGAVVVHNLHELADELERLGDDEAYVIGGADVYRQLLSYCSQAFVTRVQKRFEADRDFPNLDTHPDWELVEEGPELMSADLPYRYCMYRNQNVRKLP